MRSLLLSFAAVCVTAVHVPRKVEFIPSLDVVQDVIKIETTSSPESEVDWACDVRSWVRAPDLTPGEIHPAEARLAVNGSACRDIVKWDVGLRFKERAIVKLKTKNISDFPVKPKRPAWNASRTITQESLNDIYSIGGISFMNDNEAYQAQYNNFTKAMRNASLWDVHGAERVVFNLTQELPLAPIGLDGLDEIQEFKVHFPPIDDQPSFGTYGEDEQTLHTETQMEYFHLVHLANGTVLDIPAGKTAFIPAPSPVAPSPLLSSVATPRWPVTVDLDSPYELSNETVDEADSWMRYEPKRPDCDKDNLAHFHLHVKSDDLTVVQGQNITLNLTLTRAGNGSEYPAFLDVRRKSITNVTWIYSYIDSEEEYNSLLSSSSSSRFRPVTHFGQPNSMLRALSAEELERRRRHSESMGSSSSWSGNRHPIRRGEARYDIEKDDEEGKEEYSFQLSLQTAYNDYPSFMTTFQTIRSALSFTLYTNFLCEDVVTRENASDPTGARDEEWVEYRLPPRTTKRIRNGRGSPHRGSAPMNFVSSSEPASPLLLHYLDLEALAPKLSLDAEPITDYPKLNQILREESPDELVRFRHDHRYERRNSRQGGGWMHAAKLWQGKGKKQAAQEDGLVESGQFVVQL
ncbi:hypothetical protein IAR55_005189 [Kwoniella newhampshirensis]|uniref:Uncharacterized protein n=1 Tax=Kwoniella newhampshirensis TaxID=1651941 RepID=A0AAW0YVR8_9TREE